MKRFFILGMLGILLLSWAAPAWCHNPFISKPEKQHAAPEPPVKSELFVKIIVWQHHLKQKMSDLIRSFQTEGSLGPLLLLIGIAFGYGVIHAAGPGHGKVVAISYVLSHRPSMAGGIAFGVCIAMIHGFSGIFGVLGLRYILEKSVSQTLTSVTDITQLVSFGIIIILGMGILVKHAYTLYCGPNESSEAKPMEPVSKRGLWPWALAVGIVPCPAVVMVMLFCLSMDVIFLGLILSICIAAGMGTTISMVVSTTIMGKTGILRTVPEKRIRTVEALVSMLSGVAITAFGIIFFVPAFYSTFF